MHRRTTKELQFADRHVGLLRSSDPQEELSLHAGIVGRCHQGIVAFGQLGLQGDGPVVQSWPDKMLHVTYFTQLILFMFWPLFSNISQIYQDQFWA